VRRPDGTVVTAPSGQRIVISDADGRVTIESRAPRRYRLWAMVVAASVIVALIGAPHTIRGAIHELTGAPAVAVSQTPRHRAGDARRLPAGEASLHTHTTPLAPHAKTARDSAP
jgi:hypothetical protein